MSSNAQHAPQFRQLHSSGLLLLPNAWDAGTARLIESLGAKAIATTSAGVAWANGYADGDLLPIDRLLATGRGDRPRDLAFRSRVDVEGGYSDDPAAVAGNCRAAVPASASSASTSRTAAARLSFSAARSGRSSANAHNAAWTYSSMRARTCTCAASRRRASGSKTHPRPRSDVSRGGCRWPVRAGTDRCGTRSVPSPPAPGCH